MLHIFEIYERVLARKVKNRVFEAFCHNRIVQPYENLKIPLFDSK